MCRLEWGDWTWMNFLVVEGLDLNTLYVYCTPLYVLSFKGPNRLLRSGWYWYVLNLFEMCFLFYPVLSVFLFDNFFINIRVQDMYSASTLQEVYLKLSRFEGWPTGCSYELYRNTCPLNGQLALDTWKSHTQMEEHKRKPSRGEMAICMGRQRICTVTSCVLEI